MENINPISTPGTPASESREAEEERRDDIKRQEKAATFKKSLERTARTTPTATAVPESLARAPAPAKPRPPLEPGQSAPPLSPSLPQDAAPPLAPPFAHESPLPTPSTATPPPKPHVPAAPAPPPPPKSPVPPLALGYQPNLPPLTPAQLSLLQPPAPKPQAKPDLPDAAPPAIAASDRDAMTESVPDLQRETTLQQSLHAHPDIEHRPKPPGEAVQSDDHDDATSAAAAPPGLPPPPMSVPSEAPPVARIPLPPEIVQQMLEFAVVHTNQSGQIEFHLGLAQNILGGLRIQLAAYGNRRIGLSLRAGKSGAAVPEAELADLLQALKDKGLEVVEVKME